MSKSFSLISKVPLIFLILILAFLLRFIKIESVPVSLFSDELDVGYHAYSLIKTGKDYMGHKLPLYFESYSDFRTPFLIYSAVPSVFLFGISPLGVRLPAILFGTFGVLVFYLLVAEIFRGEDRRKTNLMALVAAFVLAVSPWHIQYSRAGFEATALVFFLLLGLYFFFKGVDDERYLLLSALSFGITVWIYSTAKLFTPILTIFLFWIYKRNILQVSKKTLIYSFLILGPFFVPMVYLTFRGGGNQRFNYISVFTDPAIEGEMSFQRLIDAQFEGPQRNLLQKITSRLIHNKYSYWISKIVQNYFETFSMQFLFMKGDLNLRHSPEGIGQFYKIEVIPLLLGSALFFLNFSDRKFKKLLALWIFVGALPSAITRDGGHHATRLILILPPLIILISYGIVQTSFLFKNLKLRIIFWGTYFSIFSILFFLYLHTLFVHNPWYSERYWHAGYKEMIESLKVLEERYQKIIITNALDQPYIFLAAYYPIPPEIWQRGFEEEYVEGFGELRRIDKFYFGQVGEEGISVLANFLDEKTLYVAAEREVGANLILEPQKTPKGLKLVKAISYPSGEPAFYLFEKERS